jgi:hypothetical protein
MRGTLIAVLWSTTLPRIRRQSVAVVMMMGLLFAQIVTVVHACPLLMGDVDKLTRVAAPDRVPMPVDCAGMADQPDATSTASACESHCNAGQQIDVQSAALAAPLGLQPALTIRVVETGVRDARATIWLSALGAAPPLSLLFGRFLI